MKDKSTSEPVGKLFWGIGIFALAWNAVGFVNLVQQLSPSGLTTLPPEYQAYVNSRPIWAFAAFAVSVAFGLFGALLVFMKSRVTFPLFIVSSLTALAVTGSTVSSGIPSLVIGSAMSVVLAAAFAWYFSRTLH